MRLRALIFDEEPAMRQVLGAARERRRRRIAEAWLERQRRQDRDGESGG
jgi:hypothetical protein